MELYKRCQPTIKKYSYVNGKFDEDLYHVLICLTRKNPKLFL